jgi:hypothetical protein
MNAWDVTEEWLYSRALQIIREYQGAWSVNELMELPFYIFERIEEWARQIAAQRED